MKIDIWIQSSDFSIVEHPQCSLDDAMSLYHETDWRLQAMLEVSLADQQKEFCHAGYGLDHPQGHRLWFCPYVDSDFCWGMFTPKLQRRFLGFVPLPDPELSTDDLSVERIPDLIMHFYSEDPVGEMREHGFFGCK